MENNKISVLLPTYNAALTIKSTIASIINQTHTNFELIIVDDGSLDNTEEVVKQFKDERIIYIYKENGGISSALNLGLEKCSSEYIARIDSDDIAYPRRLEIQYQEMLKDKTILMIGTAVDYIDDKGNVIGRTFPIIVDYLSKFIFKKRNIYAHPSVMFKKGDVQSCGGYNDSLSGLMEDYYLWAMLRQKGKCINIHVALTKYRISSEQITSWKSSTIYKKMEGDVINSLKFDEGIISKLKAERKEIKSKSKDFSCTRVKGISNNSFFKLYKNIQKLGVSERHSSFLVTVIKNIQSTIWLLYGK